MDPKIQKYNYSLEKKKNQEIKMLRSASLAKCQFLIITDDQIPCNAIVPNLVSKYRIQMQ